MSPKAAIKMNIDMSEMIINAYLGDLSDADILVRPVPGMNHIAWQLGHLIASERRMIEMVKPGSCPELPAGFEDGHNKEAAASDDAAKFHPIANYKDLWKAQRAATLSVLAGVPEGDLGKSEPNYPEYAPTVAALLAMPATHALMHCGQFVAVRRKLGKPVTL